jgi:sugar lactone lactonase YvrE
MAFSPDGARFYLKHTRERRIYAFERTGSSALRTAPRRVFAEIEPGVGSPDGAAVDAKGGNWCALHGGGRLRRYGADGVLEANSPYR